MTKPLSSMQKDTINYGICRRHLLCAKAQIYCFLRYKPNIAPGVHNLQAAIKEIDEQLAVLEYQYRSRLRYKKYLRELDKQNLESQK